MKKIIISILGLSMFGLAHANEKIGELKSSATMQATCSIEVNPLGFGVVATPLMFQSAQSDMSVKCSNASAYTIDLAYGGIYGQSSPASGYTIGLGSYTVERNSYNAYNSLGKIEGSLTCFHAGTHAGKISLSTMLIANLYGYTSIGIQQDTKGTACVNNGTQAGTYPVGWEGSWNLSGKQSIGGSSYAYGVMQGSFKGDSLAYSIAVPGEPIKVWNAGNNSYKTTGNGEFQVIPVVAKIIPDKSGSQYPAPDMYLDTVTAVISY